MITYALVDTRNGETRYLGVTSRPKDRIRNHLSEALVGNDSLSHQKSFWLGSLKSVGLQPMMIIVARGNFEHLFFKLLAATGAKLTNRNTPPQRLLLTDQGKPEPRLGEMA